VIARGRQMVVGRLCIGLLVILASTTVSAGSVTIAIRVTVLEVQCTAEQRTRIRACAKHAQQDDIGPYKTMVTVESRAGKESLLARHEILVDPSRQMLTRTLFY
jgi:hypothetical protein